MRWWEVRRYDDFKVSVFPGSRVKLGEVDVRELNCSSPFIISKRGLNAPLRPDASEVVYLKALSAGTNVEAIISSSRQNSGQYEILHLLQRMRAEQAELKEQVAELKKQVQEQAELKEQVQEHEFWLRYLGGLSPLLAILDVIRVFMQDLNKVSKQQLTMNGGDWPKLADRVQHMSKKRKYDTCPGSRKNVGEYKNIIFNFRWVINLVFKININYAIVY